MPNRVAVEVLLFDLGGVLLDVDFARAIEVWARYSPLPVERLQQLFGVDEHYRRHERGEIEAREYFAYLAATLHLSAGHEQVVQGWNSIFGGEIVAAKPWLAAARDRFPCYAFTNTNATHMACWTRLFPDTAGAFERIFTSHEIGLRKPEKAAFEHIRQAIGLPAEAILFFDDLAENVDAAVDAGFQAVRVTGPEDIARALRAVGVAVAAE